MTHTPAENPSVLRAVCLLPLAALGLLALAGCTDPNVARRALEQAGLTDIEIGGYAAFSCAESDMFATKFTATNIRGLRVSGAVCSAPLKGATVRYD